MAEVLTYEEIEKKQLELHLEHWQLEDDRLTRKFTFKNFKTALEFVNKVGEVAENQKHHPDIAFGWGYANIVTTTHSKGGVTILDLKLAAEIQKI
jgi:4a-hydroxytetrahydrobiopterin dehydratase